MSAAAFLCVTPDLKLTLVNAQTIFNLFGAQSLKDDRKHRHWQLGPPVPKAQRFGTSADASMEINLLGT